MFTLQHEHPCLHNFCPLWICDCFSMIAISSSLCSCNILARENWYFSDNTASCKACLPFTRLYVRRFAPPTGAAGTLVGCDRREVAPPTGAADTLGPYDVDEVAPPTGAAGALGSYDPWEVARPSGVMGLTEADLVRDCPQAPEPYKRKNRRTGMHVCLFPKSS